MMHGQKNIKASMTLCSITQKSKKRNFTSLLLESDVLTKQ
jgi:hypothetical protein